MKSDNDRSCDDPKQRARLADTASEALRVLEGKWKIVIICQLLAVKAPLRFSELERLVEGVNQKMLTQQLRQLEKDEIVIRTVYPQVPPKVEYTLTELGLALEPSMKALVDWAIIRAGNAT